MSEARPLPDFVGIGALKAGTTFLDSLLRQHPQLSFPRFLKEAEYFTAHHGRGPSWYAGLFDPPDARLRGEISPQYMADPLAPRRVHDANPQALVLATLRDPVARAVSQYRHWVQETGYRHDFATFLREHPGAVERSRYHRVLQPWLATFDRERVQLVVFDDLVSQPVTTAQSVFAFLGVDASFAPHDLDAATNTTYTPRFHRAYSLTKRATDRLRAGRGARLVHVAKRAGLDKVFRGGGRGSAADDPVTAEQTDALRALLQPDVEQLSELVGRDLTALWSA